MGNYSANSNVSLLYDALVIHKMARSDWLITGRYFCVRTGKMDRSQRYQGRYVFLLGWGVGWGFRVYNLF